MLKESDDLSWYARKAAARVESGDAPDAAGALRIAELLSQLRRAGVRGDPASMTLFTRGLPPGCRQCLRGLGTNLYVTGNCTRDCFFCFNVKPRRDEMVVHGIAVKEPSEAVEIVRRYGLRSIGISGGEPLMYPERVLTLLRALRQSGLPLRLDLYTNGDLATPSLLKSLKDAGLDAIRFNVVARDFDLEPVAAALAVFDEVAVEVPVVPAQAEKLRAMALTLDEMGVPHLNIHELFVCAENSARSEAQGHGAQAREDLEHLLWRPAAGAAEAALEFLLFCLKNVRRLGVYYCSCGTQENISRRGLRRRLIRCKELP